MLHEFFKDFVLKFNIRNGELASQDKLNASVNVLKKETDDLYNRSEIIRGKLAIPWQSNTLYNAGEIVSYEGVNYIVIDGQTSKNELPSQSYKWKETVRADWTLELDPNGYIEKHNTKPYTPTGPYNPAVKKYVDDGDKVVYVDQNPSKSVNFIPLDNTGLENNENIIGNGLSVTDSNYIPIYTPTKKWHPTNKLYVDNQIEALAEGGSIIVGQTRNSDALGFRPADQYLTLYRNFTGNYNGFAVKNGPLKDDINSTDWIRTTANGLLPYKPYDVITDDGSSLGDLSWKYKNVYSQYGIFDNVTSSTGSFDTLNVATLVSANFTIKNLNMPEITVDIGNISHLIADKVTAPVLDGTATKSLDSIEFNGQPASYYATKNDISNIVNSTSLTAANSINLNGYSSSLKSVKNTIALRDNSADIHMRLPRIEYAGDGWNGTHILGINSLGGTGDNYARPTSIAKLATALPAQVLFDKIKTVDGSGSGLDADLLDGHNSNFYQNASNINAGTISADRLPSTINANITGNANSADKINGVDSSNFLRKDITQNITNVFNFRGNNQFKVNFFNTAQHPHSEIHFNSYINNGSDFGYIRYDDDNDTYDKWGNSTENSAMVFGVSNDAENSVSDVVALESPAGIFLNAPKAFVGDKNGGEIWHSKNDGAGSGLDADKLDGYNFDQLSKTSIKLNYRNPYIPVQGWSIGNPASHKVTIRNPAGHTVTITTPSNVKSFAYGEIDGVIVRACGDIDNRVYAEVFDYSPIGQFHNIGSNGYKILDDGLIIQWGGPVTVPSRGGSVTVYFPIAFPNGFLQTSISVRNAAAQMVGFNNENKSSMKIFSGNGDGGVRECHWIAIGY